MATGVGIVNRQRSPFEGSAFPRFGVTAISFRVPADYPITSLLLISLFLVALTVAFEFGFGHYVGHRIWSELAANSRFWEGRLWPLVLLTLAITPFLARGKG